MIAEGIPTGWFVLATTAIVTVPPTLNALVNLKLAKRAEAKQDTVAAKVAEATVQQSKILVLAEKTHTLVNSQYGIALALIVEKAARIYEISKNAADKADLENARLKLAEHEAKQKVVDDKESST
jgi:hypothetical protein